MIEVLAQRLIEQPEYQIFNVNVQVYGFDHLTPRAARAALTIAFGNDGSGVVWGDAYGYRVYPRSTRKVYRE